MAVRSAPTVFFPQEYIQSQLFLILFTSFSDESAAGSQRRRLSFAHLFDHPSILEI